MTNHKVHPNAPLRLVKYRFSRSPGCSSLITKPVRRRLSASGRLALSARSFRGSSSPAVMAALRRWRWAPPLKEQSRRRSLNPKTTGAMTPTGRPLRQITSGRSAGRSTGLRKPYRPPGMTGHRTMSCTRRSDQRLMTRPPSGMTRARQQSYSPALEPINRLATEYGLSWSGITQAIGVSVQAIRKCRHSDSIRIENKTAVSTIKRWSSSSSTLTAKTQCVERLSTSLSKPSKKGK